MNVYTVRFCDKELIAYNLRDFARIAVFAKWYLRSQSLNEGMQCSFERQELPAHQAVSAVAMAAAPRQRRYRSSRTSSMRKAFRAFFYAVLNRAY